MEPAFAAKLRTPFFIIAVFLILVVFLAEIGSLAMLGNTISAANQYNIPRPGKGIFSLSLVDGLLLYVTLLFGSALLIPEKFSGRAQGIITFLISLSTLLGAIALIFLVIALLVVMISLLFAVPFGTIIYFIVYGDFQRGDAQVALGVLTGLKTAYAVCMAAAHQRFIQNKGLVLLFITSYICHVIISFLHSFVPGFLVSITDGVAAIVVAIIAIIWAIVFLIGAIISVIKALGGIVGIIFIIIAISLIGGVTAMMA